MTNSVFDPVTLPTTKTDLPGAVASVPASQKLTAPEFNVLLGLITDLRTTIRNLELRSLNTGVSEAGGARLRVNTDGVVELSENGGAWRQLATTKLFNVTDGRFGAVGDGTTDNWEAIQNAIDACEEAGGGIVYFPTPAVSYRFRKPLRARAGVTLRGDGKDVVTLRPDLDGWSIVYGPDNMTAIPMVDALLTGAGQAADFRTTTYKKYWNFRECGAWDLNGLAAICIEMTYQPATIINGDICALLGSSGSRLSSEASKSAFLITCSNIGAGGIIGASIRIGGVTHNLSAGSAITPGVNYHVALTYDGSTVRLFQNGVLVDSEAATGTVNQEEYESVIMGNFPNGGMIDGNTFFDGPKGIIDGVRMFPSAHYTAAFTPSTAKTPREGGALFAMNFENSFDLFATADCAGGNIGYFPTHFLDYSATDGLCLEEMSVQGSAFAGGLFAFCSIDCKIRNVSFSCRAGYHLQNNSYNCIVDNVYIVVPGAPYGSRHFAACHSGASGGVIRNLKTTGSAYPLLCIGGGMEVANFYGGGDTIPMYFSGQGQSAMNVVLTNCGATNEGYTPEALAAFDSVTGVTAFGGAFENLNTDLPLLLVDHETSGRSTPMVFCGTRLQAASGNTEPKIKILSTNPVPGAITVIQPGKWLAESPAVALSDPPNMVNLIEGGTQTVVRGLSATDTPSVNLSGSVQFTDATDSIPVVFAHAEPDAAYQIVFGLGDAGGSPDPAAVNPKWSSKLSSGFTINLDVAPGMGEAINVDWFLVRGLP